MTRPDPIFVLKNCNLKKNPRFSLGLSHTHSRHSAERSEKSDKHKPGFAGRRSPVAAIPSPRRSTPSLALARRRHPSPMQQPEMDSTEIYDPSKDPKRKVKSKDPGWKYGFWPDLTNKDLVDEDSVFDRDGSDIYVDANISFTQAILGGKVEVPTLSGTTSVKIPKGVQPGQLVVLRGKGLPRSGFFVDHGDQFVRFRIRFPTELNDKQRAIVEEFAKEEINNGDNMYSQGNWWNHALEHVITPKFAVEFSLLILILLLLNKILS